MTKEHQYSVTQFSPDSVVGNVRIPAGEKIGTLDYYYEALLHATRHNGMRERTTSAKTRPIELDSPVDFTAQLLETEADQISFEFTNDWLFDTIIDTTFEVTLHDSSARESVTVYSQAVEDGQRIIAARHGVKNDLYPPTEISREDFNLLLQNIIAEIDPVAARHERETGGLLNLLSTLTTVHFEREANYELAEGEGYSRPFSLYEKLLVLSDSKGDRRVRNKAYDLTLMGQFNQRGVDLSQAYHYSRGAGQNPKERELSYGAGSLALLEHPSMSPAKAELVMRRLVLNSLRAYSDESDAHGYLRAAVEQVVSTDFPTLRVLPYKKLK